MNTTATPAATSVDDLAPILTEFRVWSADRSQIRLWPRDDAVNESDEAGIALLRRLADVLPGFLPDPVQPCMWCSSYLRWHPGVGRWQGTLEQQESSCWTDRCAIAPSHRHEPAPLPSTFGEALDQSIAREQARFTAFACEHCAGTGAQYVDGTRVECDQCKGSGIRAEQP